METPRGSAVCLPGDRPGRSHTASRFTLLGPSSIWTLGGLSPPDSSHAAHPGHDRSFLARRYLIIYANVENKCLHVSFLLPASSTTET